MTAKSFEEALVERCPWGVLATIDPDSRHPGNAWTEGARWARDFTLKESADWKDEYDTLCKFATGFEEEADALTAQLKEARRVIDAHHKWQMEYGGEGYYDGCFESHLCQTTREFLAKLEKGEG